MKPLRLMGIPDAFVEHATPKAQISRVGLNAEGIARAATEMRGPMEDRRMAALLGVKSPGSRDSWEEKGSCP